MNNNTKILQDPIFDLPVDRDKGDFINFLKLKFDRYIEIIQKFDGDLGEAVKQHIPMIGQQMNCIFSSLHSYYVGKTARAYRQLLNCIETAKPHLWIQTQVTNNDRRDKLFRMRLGSLEEFSKYHMFHIPFELRNRVRRQRFSIPGLPCLYLSTSVYTCWEELNRPNIRDAHVSRYDLNSGLFKVLFLDTRTENIREMIKDESKNEVDIFVLNFIITFPLILACSIKVESYETDFIPEYIIPQLLLQWVIESDEIDGIQYSSNKTRLKLRPISFESEANIVIPSKELSDSGICSNLSSRIKLTNPISYNFLELANDPKIRNRKSLLSLFRNRKYNKTIELIDGEKEYYQNTIFGQLEDRLKDMEADFIK